VLGYRTKIIILLFWFRAGARPRRAPVPQCVDAPHARIHAQSARAAVRGPSALQFVLGEQGRRSSGPGPVGSDAPPSPLPRRLRPLGAQLRGQLFFLGYQTIKFLQSFFFSHETKHENRSGFARSYLAPPSRCGKERPSDRRGVVQQPPAESWEVMRSVEASHRRNTSLTLLVSNRIRGTTRPRTGQWRPPL